MQTIIALYYHLMLKEHWGFDDPAGKEWPEFQRVRDEIGKEYRPKKRSFNVSVSLYLSHTFY